MDYAPKRATAVRMLKRYGREASITHEAVVPDPIQPWKSTTVQVTQNFTAVVFPDDGLSFIEATDVAGLRSIAVCAALVEINYPIGAAFVFGSRTYTVQRTKTLAPDGSLTILTAVLLT